MIYGIEAYDPPPGGPPPTKYIAVGTDWGFNGPIIITSVNGQNWVNKPYTDAVILPVFNGIATNGTRWVAVGYDNNTYPSLPVILTSDNGGQTWTKRQADPSTMFIYNVAWTGTAFVAVGSIDPSSNWDTPCISTSPDGVTWTQRTSSPTTAAFWECVAARSGLVVAAGVDGLTDDPRISISTDNGVTWAQQTPSPTTDNDFHGAALNDTVSVIVGLDRNGNTVLIDRSTDGTTWNAQSGDPTTGVDLYAVCWSPSLSLFIAVGTDFTYNEFAKVMTSPDGSTWTARTPVSNDNMMLKGVAASGNTCVAVGHDPGQTLGVIQYSTNAIDWTQETVPVDHALLFAVAGTP